MQMMVYTIVCVIISLCCLWYVAPTCCVTGASEIMLNAVLEDISLAFTARLRVLLGTQNYSLGAVFTIDLIQCLVEPFHFLVPLSIVVDEVRLYAIVGTDTHDDDTCTLIVVALTEDPFRASGGRLHDLAGAVGRGEQPFLAHVPVLWQVFPEMVGVNEDADGLSHRLLLSELLGASGCIVADMCP